MSPSSERDDSKLSPCDSEHKPNLARPSKWKRVKKVDNKDTGVMLENDNDNVDAKDYDTGMPRIGRNKLDNRGNDLFNGVSSLL